MYSPLKKKKKLSPTPESILSLPDKSSPEMKRVEPSPTPESIMSLLDKSLPENKKPSSTSESILSFPVKSSPAKNKKPSPTPESILSLPGKSSPTSESIMSLPVKSSPENKEKESSPTPELILSFPERSSPEKKKKKKKPATISSLPEDLILSCIARLSRLYYPTLSLVSKRFGSLVVSNKLYKVRSLLNRTESCLYVLLKTSNGDTRWFNLCRKPNDTILVPIAISPNVCNSVYVSVGSEIYCIGGTCVSILDCRTHEWRKASRMRFEKLTPFACVIDEKIYVVGGGKTRGLKQVEFLDIKTQLWNVLPSPHWEINNNYFVCGSASIEGNLHLLSGERRPVYNPREGKWNLVNREMDGIWFWHQVYCEIENVMYCYDVDKERFVWFDAKVKTWKLLKSLVDLPKFPRHSAYPRGKMVDYGGKMAIFWDVCKSFSYEKEIWYAVIVLERRDEEEEDEIWGKVEWIGNVLTVSNTCDLLQVLTVTL